MSDVLGTYSFLPWLRQGIANSIQEQDGDATVKVRASIPVELTLTGRPVGDGADLSAPIKRNVSIYGPGDIVGIERDAIIRVEPRDWITNFEPNYLAHIEFADPDFPWRYTPAAPDLAKHRLRPWLTLAVAEEGEVKDAPYSGKRPLPAFELTGQADTVFPPAEDLWAWAHVHLNKDVIKQDGVTTSTNAEQIRARVDSLLSANSDDAYSRIVCPRRLKANTGYHAFLVPTFESGRLAGLGEDPTPATPAFFVTLSAWADYAGRPQGEFYPYYFRWYFKTGTVGDFEHLVRLLKPRPPDSRLGRRDMDVQHPGSNISGIREEALKGVLWLGGALKVPDEALSTAEEEVARQYEEWDESPYPHRFQKELAAFINLADDYAAKPPDQANAEAGDLDPAVTTDADPLITPPLYGRWHALTERLLFEADGSDAPQNRNWVHELNLDPRFRVPAGFGTAVIQDKQEELMDAAWGQVGDIIEANRRIRQAQLAREAAAIWHARHLQPLGALSAERTLYLTAPVHRRVVAEGFTVRHTVATSTVPRAALSPALRRAVRPRDHVAAKLGFDRPTGPERLLERLDRGEVKIAPPRVATDELPTAEQVSEELRPKGAPPWLADLVRRAPWLNFLALAILLLLAVLFAFGALAGGLPAAALFALTGLAAFAYLRTLERRVRISDAALPDGQAPPAIDALPNFPSFKIAEPGEGEEAVPGAGADSPEAARFKLALKDTHAVIATSAKLGAAPGRNRLPIGRIASATMAAIDPDVTVPRYTLAGLTIPAHIISLIGERFVEAMAYPEFDTPMYRPLLDLSTEHFLPNIQRIPQNTITLLETNQRFIEAYMVGLNHEFARELLWREYPTDQRGSYFRQFWDPSGVIDREGLSRDALREKLRDIPPIYRWSLSSALGDHDHREKPGDKEEEVVLVIRGELLKKYPNAVIYVNKARWQLDDEGKIDPSKERELETAGPEADRVKTPLYEAKVDPDIFFLGFDLTAKEAKGGTGRGDSTAPGWFFVIKERPGEPRFGLDISREGQLNVWNDLAWPDVLPSDSGFLDVGAGTPALALTDPVAPDLQEKKEQYEEDKALTWNPNMNAAELAYILYQVPVLVAVHGREMLPK